MQIQTKATFHHPAMAFRNVLSALLRLRPSAGFAGEDSQNVAVQTSTIIAADDFSEVPYPA
jgi:uncharacterized membrane protein